MHSSALTGKACAVPLRKNDGPTSINLEASIVIVCKGAISAEALWLHMKTLALVL